MDMFDVYVIYQRSRMKYYNKFYRTPKDVIGKVSELKPDYQIYLEKITKVFSESGIDPDLYFLCGMEVYGPKFSYPYFFNDRIMMIYKEKKKSLHKYNENIINSYKKSYDFMLNFMKDNNGKLSQFLSYCNHIIDNQLAPVYHYKKGLVCKYFITWLVWKKWLSHEDNPVENDYRKLLDALKNTHEIVL